jgi:PIN domain nuclease of toxin-antitoxin system
MSFLLDTHAFAWWAFDDPRLPPRIRARIAGGGQEVFVSVVSVFECATKFRIGKWREAEPLVTAFERIVAEQEFILLNLSVRHALRAGLLAGDHQDPFDRMLAAQAEIEKLQLITIDPKFKKFGTETVW